MANSENPFLLLEFTDLNSDSDADSDIDAVSNPEKIGVINSTLVLSASTSVSTSRKFPARKSFKNSRHLVLKEIPTPARPTHYSNTYDLFQLSSFHETGFKLQDKSFIFLHDKILSLDPSVTLQEYFKYSFFNCVSTFCITHLNCCSSCGVKSHSYCLDECLDCASSNHSYSFCPKLIRWLHEPDTSHHLLWTNIVRDWIISCPPPNFNP